MPDPTDFPVPTLVGDGRLHLTNASGATLVLPNTFRPTVAPASFRTPTVSLSGAHGGVQVGRVTRGQVTHTIEGEYHAATSVAAEAWLSDLRAFLEDSPLEYRKEGPGSRYTVVHAAEVVPDEGDSPMRPRVTISLVSLLPRWFDSTDGTYGPILRGTGAAWTVTNAGNATTYPVVTLTASSDRTNPTITNTTTGKALSFSGTIGTGSSLVIDTDRMTAELDGVGVLGSMGTDLYREWGLVPGVNNLALTASGSLTVRLDWGHAYA